MGITRVRMQCIVLLLAGLSLAAVSAAAQPQNRADSTEPAVGQWGKDVMWLPSEQALVDRMLDMAKVTPGDYVIDLGSGDGRIVITAARRGSRALGIEYEENLVALARRNAERAGVTDKATFVQGDIFESDFSRATVLTLFLLPELNLQLRPTILAMKPGTRIVSNSFDMGDWHPDHTVQMNRAEGCDGAYCVTYLWVVPAKVEGRWRLPEGDLLIRQKFQMLSGELRRGTGTMPLVEGRMDGSRIQFKLGDLLYNGQLVGNTLQGTYFGTRSGEWKANRVDR